MRVEAPPAPPAPAAVEKESSNSNTTSDSIARRQEFKNQPLSQPAPVVEEIFVFVSNHVTPKSRMNGHWEDLRRGPFSQTNNKTIEKCGFIFRTDG